jgi:hypothetical protein
MANEDFGLGHYPYISPDYVPGDTGMHHDEVVERIEFTVTDGAGYTSSSVGNLGLMADELGENKEIFHALETPIIKVSEKGIKIKNSEVYNGVLPDFMEEAKEVPEEYEFYIYNAEDTTDGSHIAGPFTMDSEVKPPLEAGEYKICVFAKDTNIVSEESEPFSYDSNKNGLDQEVDALGVGDAALDVVEGVAD